MKHFPNWAILAKSNAGAVMRRWYEVMLDEKIIFCGMSVLFSVGIMVLIKWHADKEYVSIFGGCVTGLVGALMRGITHQPQQTDSTQTVSSTTTVVPK